MLAKRPHSDLPSTLEVNAGGIEGTTNHKEGQEEDK